MTVDQKAELKALLSVPSVSTRHSIADGLFEGRDVIVYGAGECSHWFFEIAVKMHGCRPLAVLDRALKSGDTVEGFPGFSLVDFPVTPAILENALVVICVGNPKYYEEIVTELRQTGFRNVMHLLDVYEIHNPFNQPPEMIAQGTRYFEDHRDRILAAFDLMADDQSRDIFLRIVSTHIQRRPVALPCRPRHEQYFPSDVPLRHGHDRFVCCGAYDGDVVRQLNALKGKVSALACFEPEPLIYRRLVRYLQQHADNLADEIVTWPCALHAESGIMPFISGHGLGSRLDPEGKAQVQTTTLDDALIAFAPSFISMDIEGAEPAVLKGGERVIREHSPDLGVCVYHAPHHLWEIPLILDSFGLGYRFYLRNYTTFVIESVLYATTAA